jgi:cation:H+ antiporter
LFLQQFLFLASYLLYTIKTSSRRDDNQNEIKKELKKEKNIIKEKKKLKWTTWFWLIVGALLIFISAQWTIQSVIELSSILMIATGIIAISAVALGTSLPELVVSVSAARKKQPEMAIGNVIGSNIFNSLAVVGIPGLIGTLVLGPIKFEFSIIIILIMVAATLIYYFMVEDKEITRWEGWLLLLFYIFFIGYLFGVV